MFISVDMGGTNTRIASAYDLCTLVQPPNNILKRRNTGDYHDDLEFIIESAQKLTRTVGKGAIHAVGIGTPGTPNHDRTRIQTAVNLRQWENRPLVEPISNALGCDVYYGNDGEASALGHAYYDAPANDTRDFHYLIWGTGIGGASIEHDDDGDVKSVNKLNFATHFRDWEATLSGSSLAERFGSEPEHFTDERWQQILREFGERVLRYTETFQPQSIVFGGGLAEKHEAALVGMSGDCGVDISISKNTIHGGFGLIRFGQRHSLPPVSSDDIE